MLNKSANLSKAKLTERSSSSEIVEDFVENEDFEVSDHNNFDEQIFLRRPQNIRGLSIGDDKSSRTKNDNNASLYLE